MYKEVRKTKQLSCRKYKQTICHDHE